MQINFVMQGKCLFSDISRSAVVALPFAEFLKSNIPNDDTAILERTLDSLNEGLPIKMTREKFQRKR